MDQVYFPYHNTPVSASRLKSTTSILSLLLRQNNLETLRDLYTHVHTPDSELNADTLKVARKHSLSDMNGKLSEEVKLIIRFVLRWEDGAAKIFAIRPLLNHNADIQAFIRGLTCEELQALASALRGHFLTNRVLGFSKLEKLLEDGLAPSDLKTAICHTANFRRGS